MTLDHILTIGFIAIVLIAWIGSIIFAYKKDIGRGTPHGGW